MADQRSIDLARLVATLQSAQNAIAPGPAGTAERAKAEEALRRQRAIAALAHARRQSDWEREAYLGESGPSLEFDPQTVTAERNVPGHPLEMGPWTFYTQPERAERLRMEELARLAQPPDVGPPPPNTRPVPAPGTNLETPEGMAWDGRMLRQVVR